MTSRTCLWTRINYFERKTLVIIFLPLFLCVGRAWADLTIANKGASRYKLVLPVKALPSEHYAAEELERYIEKISGVKLPIVTDSDSVTGNEILLGDNRHLGKLKIDLSKLGPDGFVLRTDGNRLIIAGGQPRTVPQYRGVAHSADQLFRLPASSTLICCSTAVSLSRQKASSAAPR